MVIWWSSVVIGGYQWSSGGHRWSSGGHRWSSGGHRWSSGVIGGHRWSSGGHRWSSVDFGGLRWTSVVISGHQVVIGGHPVVIRGHQGSSVVIGGASVLRWSSVVILTRRSSGSIHTFSIPCHLSISSHLQATHGGSCPLVHLTTDSRVITYLSPQSSAQFITNY